MRLKDIQGKIIGAALIADFSLPLHKNKKQSNE